MFFRNAPFRKPVLVKKNRDKCDFSSLKIQRASEGKSFLSFGWENKTRKKTSNEEVLPLDFITKENTVAVRFSHSGLLRFPNPFLGFLFFLFFLFQQCAVGDNRRTCNFQCHERKPGKEMQKAIKRSLSMGDSAEPLNVLSFFLFYWFTLLIEYKLRLTLREIFSAKRLYNRNHCSHTNARVNL